MEIATASAAANALRVGLNIAVGRNRPVIEFYYEVRNDYGPAIPEYEHRRQDISISIFAVNIGSLRAEDVLFKVATSFSEDLGRFLGAKFLEIRYARWHRDKPVICFD
jgi:hypothetical protein